MSVIQIRVVEIDQPLDKYVLTDIFHLGNLKFSKRIHQNGSMNHEWWQDENVKLELVQDYFYPLKNDEVLSEYIIDDKKTDGFIIYLNDIDSPRSYKKSIEWLKAIHDGHIDLLKDMGWDAFLFIGNNPQNWLSKKFINEIKRLRFKMYNEKMQECQFEE